jgi:hypothetical protein
MRVKTLTAAAPPAARIAARARHVRRVDVVADHLECVIGFDAGRNVEGAAVEQAPPVVVLRLDPAQIAADLGFEFQIVGFAEEMAQSTYSAGIVQSASSSKPSGRRDAGPRPWHWPRDRQPDRRFRDFRVQ